ILVVDGGSTDGTHDVVAGYAKGDARVRLIDATPIPPQWNGKAWGLQVGLEQTAPHSDWVLTVDADVRPRPVLTRSLAAHAAAAGVTAMSVATVQELSGWSEGLIHPALLTTLVYRFGSPGQATRRVDAVQANGQCFLCRRDALLEGGGFASSRASLCEDVTLARHLVTAGHAVGFYESDTLVSVRMYASGWEAWRNWPRSLPLRDQYAGRGAVLGLLEVTLAQALPVPLLLALLRSLRRGGARRPVALFLPALFLLAINGGLAAVRLGILAGTARAYRRRPWSYWLSPLCDVPVATALWRSLFQRQHVWRGRAMISEIGAGAKSREKSGAKI
ncbi:MAG: glycosyltransferase family 2 protein, partial [Chloroflexota bacterium]|nr:glycosyltransferase family 2 protein [Chloroflexota bacterium]